MWRIVDVHCKIYWYEKVRMKGQWAKKTRKIAEVIFYGRSSPFKLKVIFVNWNEMLFITWAWRWSSVPLDENNRSIKHFTLVSDFFHKTSIDNSNCILNFYDQLQLSNQFYVFWYTSFDMAAKIYNTRLLVVKTSKTLKPSQISESTFIQQSHTIVSSEFKLYLLVASVEWLLKWVKIKLKGDTNIVFLRKL